MKIETLVGEALLHKSFGTGIIEEVHEKYLEVDFSEKKKHCKFMYPSCFDGYVTKLRAARRAMEHRAVYQR